MRVLITVLLLIVLSACGPGSGAPAASPSSSAPAGATPTAASPNSEPSPAASVDLSGLDACALLDEATVQGLTGESVRFVTQDMSQGREIGCFWGAAVPGVPAYVELIAGPRPQGLASYQFPAGCTEVPVSGIAIEAKGAMCPGDPHLKVRLAAYAEGVLVTLLVNQPSRPLEPADLAATLEAVAADLP